MLDDQTPLNGAQNGNVPVESLISVAAGKAIADSHTVAEVFGKRHDHVLRDIDNLLSKQKLGDVQHQWFREIAAAHPTVPGRAIRSFEMTRDGFTLLAMGFTGDEALEWKIKYLEAFNTMETKLGSSRVDDSQESEYAPLEFGEHCRRRFKEFYSGDFVSPDYLLKVLFNGNIPYTGDKRFKLLARESCEALGICDMSAVLERLPPLAKGFVTVDAGGGPCRREAISEAALYALAFSPRDLSGPQIAGAKPETAALALCYQIKTIEAYFGSVRDALSAGVPLEEAPAFQNLEGAIRNTAQAADLQLAVSLARERR